MNRFTEKHWFAWSLTAVLGLLLIGSIAAGQNSAPRTWVQIGPQEFTTENWGTVFAGPTMPAGRYMVWIAAKQQESALPYRVWHAHGPFEAGAGQSYMVMVMGSERPIATWTAWKSPEPTEPMVASVHFLNQISDNPAHGVMVAPLLGSAIPRLSLTDMLTAADPLEPRHQCRHRVYPVLLEQGKTYVIEMRSRDFDTYLMLENNRRELLAQNDDDAIVLTSEAMNSRITFQPQATTMYSLVASAFSPSGLGNYSITVHEMPVMMQVEDRLTTADEVRNYCFCKEYEVTLTAGRRYFIDLESYDFSTSVHLLNPEGMIVAFDEGGGVDMLNTRIACYRPTTTGTYRVVVSSCTERSTGAFTLAVREDE